MHQGGRTSCRRRKLCTRTAATQPNVWRHDEQWTRRFASEDRRPISSDTIFRWKAIPRRSGAVSPVDFDTPLGGPDSIESFARKQPTDKVWLRIKTPLNSNQAQSQVGKNQKWMANVACATPACRTVMCELVGWRLYLHNFWAGKSQLSQIE